MIHAFQKHLSSLIGKPETKRFLLAVSGGVDSMVMAHLFYKAGYHFNMAHCNFGLRGKESDGDEQFVKKTALEYDISYYIKCFNTSSYAIQHKVSIQMAARKLRYAWLKETMRKHKCNYLTTAHHADDVIETFFINLLRGTGIAGLHGISANHNGIIRPMLCFNRQEIESYAKQHKLKWREDSSNASDKYERNKIRHHLLPVLQQISPEAFKGIHHTIENLGESEFVYRKVIEEKLKTIFSRKKDRLLISVAGLQKTESAPLYLYEGLKPYNFNYAQAKEICESLKGQSGKTFFSPTHRLTKDRTRLIVEKIKPLPYPTLLTITQKTKKCSVGSFTISITQKQKPTPYTPSRSSQFACLDYDKLQFPLTLRKWQQGDTFYPLGMQKRKKVSDFLIDNKVPLPDKEKVYVLLSGGNIAWVAGYRISEQFKIVTATKKLYLCNIETDEKL